MGSKKSKGARSWDLANDLDGWLDESGTPDPGRFLAMVMAGQDPRTGTDVSELWALVNQNADRRPSKADWDRIVAIVLSDDRYQRDFVSSEESLKAAKTLMEFLYAKRKAIEVSGHVSSTVRVVSLTPEQIELFNEKFCDEY